MSAIPMPGLMRYERNCRTLRALIWIYFFLLIFEGFLRMVLPPLSTPLLVVREPFLLLAYLIAQITLIFPWNRFLFLLWTLGAIALTLGIFVLPGSMLTLFYGFRCSFLHVPLIFLIPKVMDVHDVERIGRWFLILSLPIAILMMIQFTVGPEHWLNRGLDNQFKQIGADVGKIRPPGTFTAVTGPVHYFSFVVAFVIYSQFNRATYSLNLVLLATIATCLAVTVSISRSALFGAGMVVITSAIGIFLARPQQSLKFVRFAGLAAIALMVASQLPIFDEGARIFSSRIEGASSTEGGSGGVLGRFLGGFDPVSMIGTVPIEGVGLGRGTNAGNVLYAGHFLPVAENEWNRILYEMGPLLGLMYVLMRIALATTLLRNSFLAARTGLILAMPLAGACWLSVLNGTWQQTTALGFSTLGAGLTLAATQSRRIGR